VKKIWIGALFLCALIGCKTTHTPIGGPDDFPAVNGNATNSGSNLSQDLNTPNALRNDDGVKEGDLNSLSGSALNPVFFDYDSSDLRSDQIAVLQSDATAIRSGSSLVIIEGHCDERGTEEYNLALGSRRADITKSYLVSQGISADRLSTISYGENKPFAKGHDESSWHQNRRAQLLKQ
jgi:peptidoglycan-associated lipoprotein